MRNLQKRGEEVRNTILKSKIPKDLEDAILKSYSDLSNAYKTKDVDVAVRSSATAEDLPGASFAGQQETYLNVAGGENVLKYTKECIASLFTDRAISYRVDKGFSHFDVSLSVGVQKMVRSDLASSGVMFTLDTETGFEDVVVINASYGLGEMVVQGAVTPDEYIIWKPGLKAGKKSLIAKDIGTKDIKMVYSGRSTTKKVSVEMKDRNKFALNDSEILELARWGASIEDYFSKKARAPSADGHRVG
jgi:pyruvate,water dikinase